MRGPRRIPAHAVDGAPNLGRQMIDTFRIPRIVVPYLTAASECTWLIGKQEQQCSGHDWRKPVCVTHPHAHTRSRVNNLAKCGCEAKIIRNANGRQRQCGAHQFDRLPRLRRQFRGHSRLGRNDSRSSHFRYPPIATGCCDATKKRDVPTADPEVD